MTPAELARAGRRVGGTDGLAGRDLLHERTRHLFPQLHDPVRRRLYAFAYAQGQAAARENQERTT